MRYIDDIFVISHAISYAIFHKDVTVACTTEMPLEIELVKAQFKVWEYQWVETVGNPHWPYAGKATETYTYEYASDLSCKAESSNLSGKAVQHSIRSVKV